MYKCCVFDLDGTLINTIFALTRTINKMLERFGYAPLMRTTPGSLWETAIKNLWREP